jgi:flavodoxin
MFEVVYFSRSGNTRKVAEAIALELGVHARNIKGIGTVNPEAFVFLGTGCYGGTLPKDVAIFVQRNKFAGRRLALFTTSAFGLASERNVIARQIKDKGAVITDNFQCHGRWMGIKRNHPTFKELEEARIFAALTAAKESTRTVKREKVAAGVR